jgi:hypothetical protein
MDGGLLSALGATACNVWAPTAGVNPQRVGAPAMCGLRERQAVRGGKASARIS